MSQRSRIVLIQYRKVRRCVSVIHLFCLVTCEVVDPRGEEGHREKVKNQEVVNLRLKKWQEDMVSDELAATAVLAATNTPQWIPPPRCTFQEESRRTHYLLVFKPFL